MITVDPRGTGLFRGSTINDVGGNVKNSINYWQYMKNGVSGTELNFNNNFNGVNIRVDGTSHTKIDGDMKRRVETDIIKFLDEKNPVKDARKYGNIDAKTLKKIKNDE